MKRIPGIAPRGSMVNGRLRRAQPGLRDRKGPKEHLGCQEHPELTEMMVLKASKVQKALKALRVPMA